MKALVKTKAEPGLWMQDEPRPRFSETDVLIRIHQTAICGTDVHIYHWDQWSQKNVPTPMIIGHEFFGEIVELGKAVTGLKIGQRVSGEGHIFCGHCRNCRAGARHLCVNTVGLGVGRTGAFAEYLSLPASNVFPLPDVISDDVASLLDPFGNAVHTALSYNLVGEDVLITGAGPIGIMAAAVAQFVGARHVVLTDINPARLELAKKLGIKHRINVKEQSLKEVMGPLGMKEGFDVALEMSGSEAGLRDLIGHCKNGAKIALLGTFTQDVRIPINDVIFKSLYLKGITGREIFETWYKMKSLIESGLDISPIITHKFPVNQFQEAFELMASGQSGKIILDWRTA